MSEWYTFVDDDICRIRFEFFRGNVYLHCLPKVDGYRVAWRVWGLRHAIRQVLLSLGFKSARAVFPFNRRWQKILRKLGFVTVAQRRGLIAMEAQHG